MALWHSCQIRLSRRGLEPPPTNHLQVLLGCGGIFMRALHRRTLLEQFPGPALAECGGMSNVRCRPVYRHPWSIRVPCLRGGQAFGRRPHELRQLPRRDVYLQRHKLRILRPWEILTYGAARRLPRLRRGVLHWADPRLVGLHRVRGGHQKHRPCSELYRVRGGPVQRLACRCVYQLVSTGAPVLCASLPGHVLAACV